MHTYHEDALKLLITIVDRGKGRGSPKSPI